MTLPMLPADKANHVVYGSAIALVAQNVAITAAMFAGLDLGGIRPKDIGLAASCAFGVGKEAVDWLLNRRAIARGEAPPHGVDPLDALATISGGAAIWSAQP